MRPAGRRAVPVGPGWLGGSAGSDIAANGTGPTRRGAPRAAHRRPYSCAREAPDRAADLQRGREHRRGPGPGPRGRARGRRARRRRRQPRRHRRPRRGVGPRATAAACRCCAGPRSRAWARPTGPASPRAWPSGYDALIEMDSDLQHDPAALPGADQRRRQRRRPGHRVPLRARRAPSPTGPSTASTCRAAATATPRSLLGLQVRDATAGFRCYAAPMLSRIDLDAVTADGYGFQIEMAYAVARRGGRIVEVPIRFTDRVRGTSKMSGRIVVEALVLVTWWALRDRVLRRRPGRRLTSSADRVRPPDARRPRSVAARTFTCGRNSSRYWVRDDGNSRPRPAPAARHARSRRRARRAGH